MTVLSHKSTGFLYITPAWGHRGNTISLLQPEPGSVAALAVSFPIRNLTPKRSVKPTTRRQPAGALGLVPDDLLDMTTNPYRVVVSFLFRYSILMDDTGLTNRDSCGPGRA